MVIFHSYVSLPEGKNGGSVQFVMWTVYQAGSLAKLALQRDSSGFPARGHTLAPTPTVEVRGEKIRSEMKISHGYFMGVWWDISYIMIIDDIIWYISGWWFLTILKHDGVRQWEGWHPKYIYISIYIPYMKWKIKKCLKPPTRYQSTWETHG